MPRRAKDYSRSCVYEIRCKDTTIHDIYIGSTSIFNTRKCLHRQCCTNIKNPAYNLHVYAKIRELGGWDAFEMIPLQWYNCDSQEELLIKERAWYDRKISFVSLNKSVPYTTSEEKTQKRKDLYQINKQKVAQYYQNKVKNVKTSCICCGVDVISAGFKVHCQSYKHLNNNSRHKAVEL